MSNLESSYLVDFPAYAGMTRPNMPDEDGDIAVQPAEPALAQPPLYKVVLHNDDYTTMEFVIFILQKIFRKDIAEAKKIMLKVHKEGKGVCGVFPHEIAESKAARVVQVAKDNKHPLKCTVEAE